jgi:hypothetical protein
MNNQAKPESECSSVGGAVPTSPIGYIGNSRGRIAEVVRGAAPTSTPLDALIDELQMILYGKTGKWDVMMFIAVRSVLLKACAFGAKSAHERALAASPASALVTGEKDE